ncbi:MAG: hypothetical protein M1814_004952 [Vezdaea aestivalis]|nr:MAG: hypothetical protein M1814_004952 [Vezdaea aestivalis]
MSIVLNATLDGSKFCGFGGHQSLALGQKIYVDGGTYYKAETPVIEAPRRTFWIIDLSTIQPVGSGNKIQNVITPFAKDLPENFPSAQAGVLWADDDENTLYRYGGQVWVYSPDRYDSEANAAQRALIGINLDGIAVNKGGYFFAANSSHGTIERLAYGAGTVSLRQRRGWYLGGISDWDGINRSSMATEQAATRPNLISWDASREIFHNQSTIEIKTPGPAQTINPGVEGILVHVDWGEQGMLVSIGGREFESPAAGPIPMDTVRVMDVSTGWWFIQKVTGDLPDPRVFSCGVVGVAQDMSSYNIYISGGMTGTQTGKDDVWILSIPTFQWIKAYEGTAPPRRRHSCNIIQNGQIAMIGGGNATTSSQTLCNADLGGDVRIFNMNTLTFGPYDPAINTYEVPERVCKLIGGNGKGGANQSQPLAGYANTYLESVITSLLKQDKAIGPRKGNTTTPEGLAPISNPKKPVTPDSAPTSITLPSSIPSTSAAASNGSPSVRSAAVAGGVLGGLAFITMLVFIILYVRRHYHEKDHGPKSHYRSGRSHHHSKYASDVKPLPPPPLRSVTQYYNRQAGAYQLPSQCHPSPQSEHPFPDTAISPQSSSGRQHGPSPVSPPSTSRPYPPNVSTYAAMRDRVHHLEDPTGALRPAPLAHRPSSSSIHHANSPSANTPRRNGSRNAVGGRSPPPVAINLRRVHELPGRFSWLDDATVEERAEAAELEADLARAAELEGEDGGAKFNPEGFVHPSDRKRVSGMKERMNLRKDWPISTLKE